MPEQQTAEPKPVDTGAFPDVAKNNAEVIARTESQGRDTGATTDFESGSALDAAWKETQAKAAAPVEEVIEPTVVEAKSDDAPAPDEAAVAAAKVESDRKAVEEAAGNEIFKGIELPPKASPRSAEAFASIKIKAAQEIATRDAELTKIKTELEEARKASANPLTPELEKEIAELREFRTKMDIEADPKFKEFDRKAETASEFIFSRLRANGVITDENIKQIKGYGGLQKVNVEKILEKVTDPSLKRLVESRLAEIEQIEFEKEQAIKKSKEDVKGYVAERQKENEQAGQTHQSATKAELDSMMQNMKWLGERKVEAGAKEEDRKAVETHNAFVKELHKEIGEAVKDDSAKMRATLIAGVAQLLFLQQVHAAAITKMGGLEKKLADAEAFITKYKKSAGSGLKESAAPPSGKLSEVKRAFDLSLPPGAALDEIARQVSEERRAKQVA